MVTRETPQRAFGDWLRQRRRALDLTQEELAAQVGCSAITLRKLEAEQRRPSKQIAERLGDVLNVPPGERAAFMRFARGDPFAVPGEDADPAPDEPPAPPRHNLPLQLTSFIGREREIAEIRRLIRKTRLVTVIGAGGTGKTRLILEAAAERIEEFPDGAWLVELAPLVDPALVPQVVATALGLREMSGLSFTTVLMDYLRPKRLLLLLDNCEHLIQACAELTETLLRACPRVSIVATSREALGIAGEAAYPLQPLSTPEAGQPATIDTLNRSEAARLFVERASAALPDFALTSASAPAVAEICRQLDGIPLAIELAAARIKLLRAEEIVARLDDRFRLLNRGSRTALPRHQTLQALIDWSYDLLSEPERILMRRLAVFAGGWTLEAAEGICNEDGLNKQSQRGWQSARAEQSPADFAPRSRPRLDMLDVLAQLANKSLVMIEQRPGAATRYRMLETIRQYAWARLEASGEAGEARERHATFYLALAEAGDKLPQPDRPAWLEALHRDHDNLRVALSRVQSTQGAAELGLRLALATGTLWFGHGYWAEGRAWLEAALAQAEGEQLQDIGLRAWALRDIAAFAGYQSDYADALARANESLKVFQALGVRWGSANILCQVLGWLAREQGDAATARLRLDEGIALWRADGDQDGTAWGLVTLGEVAIMQTDVTWAAALLDEGLTLFRTLQNRAGIAWALNHLGHLAQVQGQFERAKQLHEESLPLFRASAFANLGNLGPAWAFQGLGETALAQGNSVQSSAHFQQAMRFFQQLGDRAGVAWCLAGLAGAAALDEEPERAVQLWGAAEALRQAIGCRPAPASHATRERLMAAAREQLSDAAFEAAWATGQGMNLERAIALALDSAEPARGSPLHFVSGDT